MKNPKVISATNDGVLGTQTPIGAVRGQPPDGVGQVVDDLPLDGEVPSVVLGEEMRVNVNVSAGDIGFSPVVDMDHVERDDVMREASGVDRPSTGDGKGFGR
ncbi:hypothetical protein V6N12_019148 [Hibiscus sabdariffa]|uniref:Uncharacterized protein n=1 Tax=Hibiscus sabdariffa TaxID=183260 RepID=A0ABR2BAP4_9ROSI